MCEVIDKRVFNIVKRKHGNYMRNVQISRNQML